MMVAEKNFGAQYCLILSLLIFVMNYHGSTFLRFLQMHIQMGQFVYV